MILKKNSDKHVVKFNQSILSADVPKNKVYDKKH